MTEDASEKYIHQESTEQLHRETHTSNSSEVSNHQIGYSTEQRNTLSSVWGMTPEDNTILLTRSQVIPDSPKQVCSTSVMVDKLQPYLLTGYFLEVPPDIVPWVNDGDAGTATGVSNEIRRPSRALPLSEFLNLSQTNQLTQPYSETVVDFHQPNTRIKAIYDFREIPNTPTLLQKLISPKKYEKENAEINYILKTRKAWEQKAKELGVPILYDIPDKELLQQMRQRQMIIQQNYETYLKNQEKTAIED